VLQRKCLLLVDNCSWTGAECDVLAVTRNLRIIDIEIKISRADLKADAGKDKWWHRGFGHWEGGKDGKWVRPKPVARLWPHRIWKHYYAMPKEVWRDELLDCLASPASGVILLHEWPANTNVVAKVMRRAKPDRDAKPIEAAAVLDIARLANLRMWDAYEQISKSAVA
jgi:hypothetical protein